MRTTPSFLLALDFDGVVCDSAVECMLTSYNAYMNINHEHDKCVYSADKLATIQKEKFLEFRPLVRIAKEYYLLWCRIIDNGDLGSMRSLRPKDDKESKLMNEYHNIFFSERKVWMRRDFNGWLACNPLYPGMKEIINKTEKQNLAIISAKDKESIQNILEANSCSTEDIRIYGSETGLDKKDLALQAGNDFDIPLSRIMLIDDNLENLVMIRDIGVRITMAGWGYSLDREKAEAERLGIQILKLDDITDWVSHIAKENSDCN